MTDEQVQKIVSAIHELTEVVAAVHDLMIENNQKLDEVKAAVETGSENITAMMVALDD